MAVTGALGFLTVLPVRGDPGKDAPFFPVVGALLGVCGAGMYLAAGASSFAGLLTLAFWTALTGARHERSFAAVAGGGLRGALAVAISVAARWQALTGIPALDPARFALTLAASLAVSRAGMIALAWIVNPVGEGAGRKLAESLPSTRAVLALVLAIALALAAGLLPGLWMLAAAYGVVLAARWFFSRSRGGVDAESLFAAGYLTELLALAAAKYAN